MLCLNKRERLSSASDIVGSDMELSPFLTGLIEVDISLVMSGERDEFRVEFRRLFVKSIFSDVSFDEEELEFAIVVDAPMLQFY